MGRVNDMMYGMRGLVHRSILTSMFAATAGCNDAPPATTEADGSTGSSTSTGSSSSSSDEDGTATTGPLDGTSESSSGTTGPACPANTAPDAPTVVSPEPGRIDVTADSLAIVGSDFVDPDSGDVFGGVELEIWRFEEGVPSERVWSAELAGASPPVVTLADGTFDAGPTGALEQWEDHVVRIRYRDAHAECSEYGPWSADLLFRTDDGSTALFDDSVVRDFYLEIPPASWAAIDAEAYPPGCVPFDRSYHSGTLRYEDQTLPGVGIKIKGGCGSSRDLGGKASFKVDLEWDDEAVPGCPGPRRLLGQNHLTFNNGVQDSSASHERMAYSVFREAGLPTPRIAHVRLFVNDELWGLYQHVETVDRRFLSRWFASNDGMMYEGTYWCDLISSNLPPTDDDDSACLTREFSPDPCSVPTPGADPLDYALLRAMITEVEALPGGGFYPAITTIFDFDRFLTTWAVESVIGHWDNYAFSIKNNYRVYHDPTTGLWTLISTGLDQTFESDVSPWGDADGVLATRCLAEPDCEAAFAARLAEVNDRFEATDLAGRAEDIFTQISPYVLEDPRREYDFGTFQAQHQNLLGFIAARPDRIRDDLASQGF